MRRNRRLNQAAASPAAPNLNIIAPPPPTVSNLKFNDLNFLRLNSATRVLSYLEVTRTNARIELPISSLWHCPILQVRCLLVIAAFNDRVFSQLKYEDVKPTPTMKLDRDNDEVYKNTMNVVKAVLLSNQEVMASQPEDIFNHVKVNAILSKSLVRDYL